MDKIDFIIDTSIEDQRCHWSVSYMPSFDGPGITGYEFKGTEEELTAFLNKNCKCNLCQDIEWNESQCSAEYIIDRIID